MDSDKEPMLIWGAATGLGVWLVTTLLVVANWRHLPPQVPLWYSLPSGESQLADKTHLAYVLGSFLGLMLVDILIARNFKNNTRLLSTFMVWGGAATMILLALTMFRIIEIVL
jgi:hypothetical protein